MARHTAAWGVMLGTMLGLVPLRAEGVRLDAAFHPQITDGRTVGQGSLTVVQPDGKIIVDYGRQRFLPDGSRDTTYALDPQIPKVLSAVAAPDGRIFGRYRDAAGNDGYAIFDANAKLIGLTSAAVDVGSVFQPDGKILTTGLVRLNRDGSVDPSFNAGSGGAAASLALQADGKILVGGYFESFDGVPRKYLVRLTSSGLVDQSFTAEVNHVVSAVQVLGNGKILAFDGLSRVLALLNSDGSLDRVVIPGGNYYVSYFQPLPDGRMLALGAFNHVAGVANSTILPLTAEGAVDPTFHFAAPIHDAQSGSYHWGVQPDGHIILAQDNQTINRILRLNTDGSFDAAFGLGSPLSPNYLVSAARADGRIYVAGSFSTVDGVARLGIARLLADGTLDPSFAPETALTYEERDQEGKFVARIELHPLADGGVLVAGASAGSNAGTGLARYAASGAVVAGLTPVLNSGGRISSAALLADGRLLIGGTFTSVNGQARANLAAFQASGALDGSFGSAAGTNGAVTQVAVNSQGRVFVLGDFTTLAGERRTAIGALTSAGALDATFVPTGFAAGDKLTVFAPTPDGGFYTARPGVIPPGVFGARTVAMRFKASGEVDAGFTFPFQGNATFNAMTTDAQGRLITAYTVVETGDLGLPAITATYLQRFELDGKYDASFDAGMGFSTAPNSVTLTTEGTLIASGPFTTFDDLPVTSVVRLVPGGAAPTGLINISSRAETAQGANVLTAGFVIGGTQPKTILIRASGPSLTQYGVTGVVLDPAFSVYRSAGPAFAGNDNSNGVSTSRPRPVDIGFQSTYTAMRLGAFAIGGLESALVVKLEPGAYTVQARSAGAQSSGVTLVEVYDANVTPGDRKLLNISTRGNTGGASRPLIAGFVITGTTPRTVLVRGIGPGLAGFGTAGALTDPWLTLKRADGTTVAANDDWGAATNAGAITTAATQTGAFALGSGSKDAAALVTLPPGAYTAVVESTSEASSGVALVEVYEVP